VANPQIVVDFIANTTGLATGFKDADRSSSKFSSSLKGLAATGALAAGAAGVGALVFTLKTGFGEFQDSQKVAAQTAAVLKSTGDAANVSADQVAELAGALLKKTGIDDEAIQSGENLLLTFTNVRNETGKGNDIFNQATKAMTDLSVATGEDMSSAAVQLGKALNDPIKGVTALQRVGVTFTDTQKEQIKTLEDSGHTMEAQKIILGELTKEFGGSAEAAGKTFNGQINILRETFNNWAGELVGKIIPVLQDLMSWLQDHWPAISKAITTAWETQIRPALNAMIDIISGLIGVVKLVVGVIADNWSTIGPIVSGVARIVKDQIGVITDVLKVVADLLHGDWSKAWVDFKDLISKELDLIKTAITTEVKLIRAILDGLWEGVKAAAELVWDGVVAIVKGSVDDIKDQIAGIAGAVSGMIRAAGNAASALGAAITGPLNTAAGIVKQAVAEITGAVAGIAGAIDAAAGAAGAAAARVANAIKAPINSVIGAWNSLQFTVPGIEIPSVTVLGHKIGGGGFPGFTVGFPNIPFLAAGGLVTGPTLAMVGEAGPELVLPLGGGDAPIEVRVFIGETELRGLVRAEVVTQNNRTAQTLLAGLA
jgi:hypothetical protein